MVYSIHILKKAFCGFRLTEEPITKRMEVFMETVEHVSNSFQRVSGAENVSPPDCSGNFLNTFQYKLSAQDAAASTLPVKNIIDKMHAEHAVHSSGDNPIIKVTLPGNSGRLKEQAIFINGIDTSNATLAEMYALCFYADQAGIGSNNVNKFRSCMETAQKLGYLKKFTKEEAFLNRQNWNMVTAQVTIHCLECGFYDQAKDGRELLGMFSDVEAMWKDGSENDWRTMDAETWDKMLKNMDDFIDAWKERLKLLREAQNKASAEAARRAPAAYQAMAAQSAWNAVALLGTLSSSNNSICSTIAANVAAMVDAASQENVEQ